MESWRARLEDGDSEAAWDLFLDRYRGVILATIRRNIEGDDVADAFAHVCQALSADQLARLRRYRFDAPRRARFSTWLVTVVHNQVIDWVRHRDGRRRVRPPAALSAMQRRIFTCVFVEQRSHAETFEIVRSDHGDLSFGQFLRALAETYRTVEHSRPRGVMHYLAAPAPPDPVEATDDVLDNADIGRRIAAALNLLTDEERVALRLFVVEGMPAADVARMLGWPNAKAVYNRVYRALRTARAALEEEGVRPDDL